MRSTPVTVASVTRFGLAAAKLSIPNLHWFSSFWGDVWSVMAADTLVRWE